LKHKAEMVRDASLGKGEVESSILSGSTIKSTAYAMLDALLLCRTPHEHAGGRGKNPAYESVETNQHRQTQQGVAGSVCKMWGMGWLTRSRLWR
jgi:hypothetical protein